MTQDERPNEFIERLKAERQNRTNEQILDELSSLPVLPDEEEYETASEESIDQMEHHLWVYLALLRIARDRHLKESVPLFLERASFGDMGETMRGLPDILYHVAMDEEYFRREVMQAAESSLHRGARMWAIDALRGNTQPDVIDLLVRLLHDSESFVIEETASVLRFLVRHYPELQPRILDELTEARSHWESRPDSYAWKALDVLVREIERGYS